MDADRLLVPCFVGFMLLLIAAILSPIPKQKDHIHQVLKKRGARNIEISWHLSLVMRNGLHLYEVRYEDKRGKSHVTTCMASAAEPPELYWKDE